MNKVIKKWNDKYDSDELVFGTTPNGFLTEQSNLYRPNGRILAVGDGEGRNGVWLAEQGFTVLSVDGAQNGVRKAIQQAGVRNVSHLFDGFCVDLMNWGWPADKFDGVACLHLYFMPEDRPIMHKAMMNSLKSGGILVLECFHPDHAGQGRGGPSIKELCYTQDDLAADFANYHILLLEEVERELAPSTFHDGGMAKVSRIVARKP